MTADLSRLLRDAVAALEEAGLSFAVMGGCARNAYAEPRGTKDVDLVVAADATRYPRIVQALADRGFYAASTVGGGGEDAVPDLTLNRDADGRRIDLLFAHTEFERGALERSQRQEPFAGISVPVVSVEDLIIYKVLADRPQDRVDIGDVVRATEARGGVVDWSHVERWCDAWEVRPRLDRLRASLLSD